MKDKDIQKRGKQLGYTGVHSLNTSGDPDEDECGMVNDYLEAGWELDAAIHEVVRTRKYREQD